MIIFRAFILATALAGVLDGSDIFPIPQLSSRNLAAAIHDHINQDRFQHASWGIKIESLDSGQVLFEHNADKLLKPASNAKLFTAALALDRLGADHRLRTSLYAHRPPSRAGTIEGDLYVYGRGDFSFAARFHDGDYSASLKPLVDAFRHAGIRRVRGGLVGDASYFHGPPYGASWTWDDLQNYYGAEVSALTQEDNVVDLKLRPGPAVGAPCDIETRPQTAYLTFVNRTVTVPAREARQIELYQLPGRNVVYVNGQLPLHATNWSAATPVFDAPLWFVTQLHLQLQQHQIQIRRPPGKIDWLTPDATRPDYRGMVEVASVESPPLRELIHSMMKPSQNLYAQALFLQVGRYRRSITTNEFNTRHSTENIALAELSEFLIRAGIPTNSVQLDEGSGLSRRALMTPNAIVGLLKYMDEHRHAEAFRSSLPVAGVDGTLRQRMNGTAAEGRVRAKTGTLAHVCTLSGYATTASRERLAFSFMLNNNPQASNSNPRSDLDTLAVMLASLDAYPTPAPTPGALLSFPGN